MRLGMGDAVSSAEARQARQGPPGFGPCLAWQADRGDGPGVERYQGPAPGFERDTGAGAGNPLLVALHASVQLASAGGAVPHLPCPGAGVLPGPLGVFLFGQARQPEDGSPGKTLWIWQLKRLYAALMGFFLVCAVQHLPWMLAGTGPLWPMTVNPGWAI